MSDTEDGSFDKEAEKAKLREQLRREEENRRQTQHMSELLLKGATMTNKHCDACGDPLFRYEGQEFCPTCSQDGGADADGNLFAPAVEDGDALSNDFLAGFDGAAEGTHGLADVGAEDVVAFLADGLVAGHARDLLGGAVKRSDVPVAVDAEDAVRDGIENDALGVGSFHGVIIEGGGCRNAMARRKGT